MYMHYRGEHRAATAAAGEAFSRQFAQALHSSDALHVVLVLHPTGGLCTCIFVSSFAPAAHGEQLAAASRCRHLLHFLPCCTLSHTVYTMS